MNCSCIAWKKGLMPVNIICTNNMLSERVSEADQVSCFCPPIRFLLPSSQVILAGDSGLCMFPGYPSAAPQRRYGVVTSSFSEPGEPGNVAVPSLIVSDLTGETEIDPQGGLALLREVSEPLLITGWHDMCWLFELERAKSLGPAAQALWVYLGVADSLLPRCCASSWTCKVTESAAASPRFTSWLCSVVEEGWFMSIHQQLKCPRSLGWAESWGFTFHLLSHWHLHRSP